MRWNIHLPASSFIEAQTHNWIFSINVCQTWIANFLISIDPGTPTNQNFDLQLFVLFYWFILCTVTRYSLILLLLAPFTSLTCLWQTNSVTLWETICYYEGSWCIHMDGFLESIGVSMGIKYKIDPHAWCLQFKCWHVGQWPCPGAKPPKYIPIWLALSMKIVSWLCVWLEF